MITNEHSSELLKEYSMLFSPFIQSGEISICRWNEEGREIETAIPDIHKLIKGQMEWRAVIVLNPAKEEKNSPLGYDEHNPFDYAINAKQYIHTEESKIPLIRLTHMLAGFPYQEVKEYERTFCYYDDETQRDMEVRESNLTKEQIEKIQFQYGSSLTVNYSEKPYTEQEKAAIDQLRMQYSSFEEPPCEMILITTRSRAHLDSKQQVANYWRNKKESESSDFWIRNQYPTCCRFLCFDMNGVESSKYVKEVMNFWLSVLSIATNRINASTLQAYRLYQVHVDLDIKKLDQALNQHLSKMIAAQNSLSENMRVLSYYQLKKGESVLEEVDIPISYEEEEANELFIYDFRPSMYQSKDREELYQWEKKVALREDKLNTYLKIPHKAIDTAVQILREQMEMFFRKEYEVDAYQESELKNKVQELEYQVIRFSPTEELEYDTAIRGLEGKKQAVIDLLEKRPGAGRVMVFAMMSIALIGIGFLPYLLQVYRQQIVVQGTAWCILLMIIGLVLITGLVRLLYMKHKIKKEIRHFNEEMKRIIAGVTVGIAEYQKYLSKLCTYMKGKAIYDGIREKRRRGLSLNQVLKNHAIALKKGIEREEHWCAVYGILRQHEVYNNIGLIFKKEVLPLENPIYQLSNDETEKQIPINDSGDMVRAPYPFVRKLYVEREEVYE